MALLRRTTPVALMVGAVIAVLFSTFQAVDGIFANPGMITSAGYLFAYLVRVYVVHLTLFLILLFVINLLLCIFFPKRMGSADYARLLEYEVWASMFVLLVLLYLWKDKTTVGELLRERRGVLPKLFFVGEVIFIFGFLSFVIAGAVHQLSQRLQKGQLALYISSVAWFMLLFPLIAETILVLLAPKLHPVLQLVILVVLAFIVSFVVKFLNRFTMALIGMKRRAWTGLTALVVVGLILWGVVSLLQPRPSFQPRSGDEVNIILLSIDALRADHLGCYGYQPDYPEIEPGRFTPNIDRFASQGVLFEQAYSSSPWTLASTASWMTGGWPVETGGTYINRRVYRAMTTLPEALTEEGYAGAAFTSNPFMAPQTGIGRGFDRYWEFFHASHLASGLFIDELNFWIQNKLDIYGIREGGRMMADVQLRQTFDWLEKHQDDKFFLWVHLYDPHYPWAPPSPYKEDLPDIGGEKRAAQYRSLPDFRMGAAHHRYGMRRHIVNLYDAEIRFSDEVVGDILAKIEELDLTKDTLVVITSDHGEEFFDHNGLEHGHTVYDEVLHVPLIYRLPGRISEGKRIVERVSMIDLYPTLMDFGRASVEPKVYRGESLKDAILAADMSLAGNGQMNLSSWSGGKRVYFDFSEHDEDGFAGSSSWAGIIADGDKGDFAAVTEAAEILRGAARSRLSEDTGYSLVPSGDRVVFAEDLFYFDHELKAIIIGNWKLIHSRNRFKDSVIWGEPGDLSVLDDPLALHFVEGDELYNIAVDPDEVENLIYQYPEVARYLLKRMREIVYYDQEEAMTRSELEGKVTYFGAGLKNLTRGYGYW